MRRSTPVATVRVRLRGACVSACALAVASSLALGVASGAAFADARAGIPSLAGHDVFTVTKADGADGDVYLVKTSDAESDAASDDAGSDGRASDAAAAGAPRMDATASVTRVGSGTYDLPIGVTIAYSLDGPNVSRDEISGASGLVGVHVVLDASDAADDGLRSLREWLSGRLTGHKDGLAAGRSAMQAGDDEVTPAVRSQRMLVMFSIPTSVAAEVQVGDGAVTFTQGSNTVVASVMRVGERFDCYMTAKRFRMGQLTAVSVNGADALAGLAQSMGDGEVTVRDAGSAGNPAAGAAESANAGGSSRNQALIDQLTALRDLERGLAASETAAQQAAYDKAFHAYMAAYVGSYTNHLSGSIGTSTQLTALMGTAGELSGDTPLAAAVLDEANATDALASAHQHAGAAEAIEQTIRIVRAQGVDGLAATLTRRAGEEQTEGAKAYAAGQSQLSQAMIPYSMAYTDVYTKHLSELTGGSSAGASAHRDAAIAATDAEFAANADLKADTAKVDAAMGALAAARERTGAASAYRQIVLRFADELSGASGVSSASVSSDSSDAGANGTAGSHDAAARLSSPGAFATAAGGMAQDTSLSARAEAKRLKRLAREQRAAAAQSHGDVTTTVVDVNAGKTDADDVMKFAGGIPGAGGASSKESAENGASGKAASGNGARAADGSGAAAGAASDDGSRGTAGSDATGKDGATRDGANLGKTRTAAAGTTVNRPSPYVGMTGPRAGASLVIDTTGLINDTTALGDAGALIRAALSDEGVRALLPAQSQTGGTAQVDTRFLIVEPGLQQ